MLWDRSCGISYCLDPKAAIVRRRKAPWNVLSYKPPPQIYLAKAAKTQAARPVSRRSLKLSPSRIISKMDNIFRYYLMPILPSVLQTCTDTKVDAWTCLVQQF